MINSICSPEMAFNSNSSDRVPHAYVAFDDDEVSKEVKSLTFFKFFPSDWRTKGWNKDYLYKVFWSPVEDDSPQEMLKRVAEVPVFEAGASFEDPGYYRAAVVAVKESRQELEEFIDSKRVSVGVLKYKHTSFDLKPDLRIRKSDDSKKPDEDSKAKASKKKKLSGMNKEAHKEATKELSIMIRSQFQSKGNDNKSGLTHAEGKKPSLTSMKSGKPKIAVKNSVKSEGAETVRKQAVGMSSTDVPVKYKPTTAVTKGRLGQSVESGHLSTGAFQAAEKTSQGSARKKREAASRASFKEDSTSSSEEDIKRTKFDPDFTPQKYEEVKHELQMTKNSVERLKNINRKMNENLTGVEDERDKLQKDVIDLKSEIEYWKELALRSECNSDAGNFCKTELEDDFESQASQSGREEASKMSPDALFPEKEEECSNASGTKEDGARSKDQEIVKQKDETKDLVLASKVTIPAHQVERIMAIPKGAKKDLPFVKALTILAFGPEVLAASSICGTKKGGVRKNKGEPAQQAKQKLDADIVQALRDELFKRVQIEDEALTKQNEKDHDRTTKERFHSILRQAQKRVRLLGYGAGTKNNDVPVSLLYDKEK